MLYPERPKIKLQLTASDKIIEIIGWCIVIAMWGIVVSTYSGLPGRIPVHYNSVGQVDAYGNKLTVWVLLIIGSVIYAGLFILSKITHVFSYPTKITQENALSQYTTYTKMLRYVNLIIIIIICFLVIQTVKTALGNTLLCV